MFLVYYHHYYQVFLNPPTWVFCTICLLCVEGSRVCCGPVSPWAVLASSVCSVCFMDVRIKACVACVCVLWNLCCGQGLCGVLWPVSVAPPVCSCVLDQFVALTTNLPFFSLCSLSHSSLAMHRYTLQSSHSDMKHKK